jgi:hypothetical protein
MPEQKNLIEKTLERIDRKLGFLVGEKVREKQKNINDQVEHLSRLTTDYNEISFILGISPKHASKELSKLKSRIKSKAKKGGGSN